MSFPEDCTGQMVSGRLFPNLIDGRNLIWGICRGGHFPGRIWHNIIAERKKDMIYPQRMQRGDLIGVTATSAGIYTERDQIKLDLAYSQIESLGYHIMETENVRTNRKLVSSGPRERADQFMALWEDGDVRMIAQVFGGELLIEMLPFLDPERIAASKPKWVTGFSDSSLLNFYLTTAFNIATATMDNILYFGMEELHPSLTNQISILEECGWSRQENFDLFQVEEFEDERYYEYYNLTEPVVYSHLYGKDSEKVSGRIIGGCIDVLRYIIGTPFDHTREFCSRFPEGMLWYLDNCQLTMPEFRRTLWQAKNAGWFENARGILVGRTYSEEIFEDYEYADALHDSFDELGIPVICDVDIGHVQPQWTMINGAYGEFTYENGEGELVTQMC